MPTRLTVVAMVFVLVMASITPAVAASGVSTSADGIERAVSDTVEESTDEEVHERLQTSTALQPHAQSTTDETTEPSSSEGTSAFAETRYVLINTTTGVSHSLQPGEPVADLGVPAGEYLVREYGGQNVSMLVDEFTISVNADGDVSRAASSGRVATTTSHDDDIQVRASVGRDSQGTYAVGKTVNISVSVANYSGSVPTPVGDANMTVTVFGPNGDTVSERTVSSSEAGAVVVPVDTSGLPSGEYSVDVSSNVTSYGDSTQFTLGPRVTIYPQFTDGIEVDRETNVTVGLSQWGAPIADESVNVTIEGPSGNKTVRTVQTGEDGFASFAFTPTQSGEYWLSPTDRPGEGTVLTAGDAIAQIRTNDGEFSTYIDAGEPVQLTGYVMDENEPAAGRDIIVRIFNTTEDFEGTPIENITTTTDAFGQYAVTWDSPTVPGSDYEARLFTPDGERIVHGGGRINLDQAAPSGGDSTSPDVDLETTIQAPGYRNIVSPGDSVDVVLTATDGGTSAAGVEVDYALTYEYDEGIEATGTVITNESGQATVSIPVGTDAPDGKDFEITTVASINDTQVEDSASGVLQQYRLDYERLDLNRPGEPVGYRVTYTDAATGSPVSGVPLMISGETTDSLHGKTFDRGTAVSDSTGVATVNVTLPTDATREYLFGPRYPYFDGGFPVEQIEAYDISINGLPGEIESGESVTFNYTADTVNPTGAVVMLTTYDDSAPTAPDAALVDDRKSVTLTAPSTAEDVRYSVVVRTVSSQSQTSVEVGSVRVNGSGSGDSTPVADAGLDRTAETNQTVELDGTGSYDPDGESLTYEWTQIDGPAVSLNETDTATPTVDLPGDVAGSTLTFQLTVSDGSQTDTDTVSVTAESSAESRTISGRVLYPDRTTQADDTLFAFGSEYSGAGLPFDYTDTEGAYEIEVGADPNVTVGFSQGDALENRSEAFPRDGVVDIYTIGQFDTSTQNGTAGNITLPEGHVLNVTVVDGDDTPVQNATIAVRHLNDGTQYGYRLLKTDADGRLHLGASSTTPEYNYTTPPGLEVTGDVMVNVTPPENASRFENTTYSRSLTIKNNTEVQITLEERSASNNTGTPSWSESANDSRNTGSNAGVVGPRSNPELLWRSDTARLKSGVSVVDGVVYAADGSESGEVMAFDAQTGEELWNRSLGSRIRSAPLVEDNTVYVGGEYGAEGLWALNASTGETRWNISTNDYVISNPTIENGSVYFATNNGQAYAANASTGEVEWNRSIGGQVWGPIAAANGTVFMQNDDYVHALDADTGDREWLLNHGNIDGGPTVGDGLVYVAAEDEKTVYAVDAQSGGVEWEYTTSTFVDGTPTLWNGTVYVPASNKILALDSPSGELQWRVETEYTRFSMSIANERLYVPNSSAVDAYDPVTGERYWSTSEGINDTVTTAPAIYNGTVYVGHTGDIGSGGLVAITGDRGRPVDDSSLVVDGDADGDDEYASIQAAINAVESGGTVRVKPGTYDEAVVVNKSVTLVGDADTSSLGPGTDAPVLDGDGRNETAVSIAQGTHDVTVRGFEIREYAGEGAAGIIATGGNTSNVEITDNYIHNVTQNGISAYRSDKAVRPHSNYLIERNRIEQTRFGLVVGQADSAVVRNNHITGAEALPETTESSYIGIQVAAATGVRETSDIVVADNTIRGYYSGTGSSGIAVWGVGTNESNSTVASVDVFSNDIDAEIQERGINIVAWSQSSNSWGRVTDVDVVDNDVTTRNANDTIALGGTPGKQGVHEDVTILANRLDGGNGTTKAGFQIYLPGAQRATGITIAENTIRDTASVGAAVRAEDDGVARSLSFENNSLSTGDSGIRLAAVDDSKIANVAIDGNGFTGYDESALITDSSSSATIDGIQLRQNTITNNAGGVDVRSAATADALEIHNNIIDDNTDFGVRNDATPVVNATYNWWGQESGPEAGDCVGNVTCEPALESKPTIGDDDEPATGPPALPGLAAPTDPDGDGLYEDLNGDGEFTVADVQTMFANLDSESIREYPDAYDFNGDGTVDISDVQWLFVESKD